MRFLEGLLVSVLFSPGGIIGVSSFFAERGTDTDNLPLSRNVGPAGDGRSVGNNRPRSWMACGRRCAVAGPTVRRTGSRSFPIASASSVSRAVVVVRHAKRCSDTGIPEKML